MMKQKKHMVLVTDGFPFGEYERSFLQSEFEQLYQNYDLTIMARGGIGEKIIYDMPPDIEVHQWNYFSKSLFRFISQIRRREVREELTLAIKNTNIRKCLTRCKQILAYSYRAEEFEAFFEELNRRKKIDIIYTYWCSHATLAAARQKAENQERIVISRFHGYDLFDEREQSGWQCFRKFIAKHADGLFFVSEQGKKYFVEHWGKEYKEKCRVCYLGTKDFSRIEWLESKELCLVSCSNCIPLKRIDLIIEALSKLPDDIKVSWNHVGEGAERIRLEESAVKLLGKKDNVRYQFMGFMPNHEIPFFYAQIKPQCFITTSSSEGGAPVSVQEALCMGIAAIGTNVGGIAEIIIDGENGYLLRENPTAEQIKDTIVDFANLSFEKKMHMGEKGRLLWEKHLNAEKNAELFVDNLKKM